MSRNKTDFEIETISFLLRHARETNVHDERRLFRYQTPRINSVYQNIRNFIESSQNKLALLRKDVYQRLSSKNAVQKIYLDAYP